MGQQFFVIRGERRDDQLTLDVADVRPLRVEQAARLIRDFLLEPLDFTAQV